MKEPISLAGEAWLRNCSFTASGKRLPLPAGFILGFWSSIRAGGRTEVCIHGSGGGTILVAIGIPNDPRERTRIIQRRNHSGGRVEIVNIDRILSGLPANVVGCSVSDAAFQPGAGQPDAEGVGIVVAPALD